MLFRSGITETTDSISLIVSEETGIISMARGGKLTRHLDAHALETLLGQVYGHGETVNLLTALLTKRRQRNAPE